MVKVKIEKILVQLHKIKTLFLEKKTQPNPSSKQHFKIIAKKYFRRHTQVGHFWPRMEEMESLSSNIVSGHSSPAHPGIRASGHSSPADARSNSMTRLRRLQQPELPQLEVSDSQSLPSLKGLPVRNNSRDSLPVLPPAALKRSWTKSSNISIASAATSIGSEITDSLNLLRHTGSQALKFPFLPPIQVFYVVNNSNFNTVNRGGSGLTG